MSLLTAELNHSQFQEISRIVYRQCGISLKSGKEALVRARLMKRLRALDITSVKAYMELISSEKGKREIDTLIDVCDHTPEQAEQCSLIVHYKGKCTVKTGEYDDLKPRCTRLLQAGLSAEIY